ncbi:hypothetical protein [Paenibacillus sp. CH40]|uniref:hypothetical protein n=1 Tax=Paenibacillus sp. CH40 TaxID=2962045 RepID=UPI0020B6AE20|nr:hypothetical protein [Paenibacillus sp. CH40]MCP3792964.1 hypothetical protein [Paenibacillus sp. CH40]
MSNPKFSALQALNVAQEYINKRNNNYNHWTIDSDTNKSVQYYDNFFALTGGAWVVEVDFKDFEEFLVISDEEKVISFSILGIDRNKLPKIYTQLTIDRLLQISRIYNDEYQLEGVINSNSGESIAFYEKFEGVEGYSWIIDIKVPPSPFGGGDMISLVLSDEKECVEYMFDPSGYPVTPHLEDDEDEDD